MVPVTSLKSIQHFTQQKAQVRDFDVDECEWVNKKKKKTKKISTSDCFYLSKIIHHFSTEISFDVKCFIHENGRVDEGEKRVLLFVSLC